MVNLQNCHALVVLGGFYHQFAAFGDSLKALLEAEGATVETTFDLDRLTHLDSATHLVISYTCFSNPPPPDQPPGPSQMRDDQIASLTRWVDSGGGLLGVHSATVLGASAPALGQLLGGRFLHHPAPLTFTVAPFNDTHPITEGVEAFEVFDELYHSERQPGVSLHMVSVVNGVAQAQAWSKPHGQGRVAYVAPGHFPEIWAISNYQRLLKQAAAWVLAKT
jgi:uncharacterized protein